MFEDRRLYYVAGAAALVAILLFLRKGSSSSQPTAPTQADLTGSPTSAISDTQTWPYNQLALPYNYTAATANQVQQNVEFLDPQSANYVGYQQQVVQ